MYRYVKSMQKEHPKGLDAVKMILYDFHDVRQVTVNRLNLQEIKASMEIHDLKQWAIDEQQNHLESTFGFRTFQECFSFMNQTALIAQQMKHYPRWKNHKNDISVNLSTDFCYGISIKDIILAQVMDSINREIKINSVNNLCDTGKLITTQLVENWNQNYINIQKRLFSNYM